MVSQQVTRAVRVRHHAHRGVAGRAAVGPLTSRASPLEASEARVLFCGLCLLRVLRLSSVPKVRGQLDHAHACPRPACTQQTCAAEDATTFVILATTCNPQPFPSAFQRTEEATLDLRTAPVRAAQHPSTQPEACSASDTTIPQRVQLARA